MSSSHASRLMQGRIDPAKKRRGRRRKAFSFATFVPSREYAPSFRLIENFHLLQSAQTTKSFADVHPENIFNTMANIVYHPSIEGAQHGAKSLPQFLAYAAKSG